MWSRPRPQGQGQGRHFVASGQGLTSLLFFRHGTAEELRANIG